MIDKEVFGAMGLRIGRVKDAVLDPHTWHLEEIEVGLSNNVAKDFGMKKILGTTSVHLSSDTIMSIGDIVSLKLSKAELQRLFQATVPPEAATKAGS